ncbi:hypothetical protein AB0E82_19560, partial [Streptomyces anulatus]
DAGPDLPVRAGVLPYVPCPPPQARPVAGGTSAEPGADAHGPAPAARRTGTVLSSPAELG